MNDSYSLEGTNLENNVRYTFMTQDTGEHVLQFNSYFIHTININRQNKTNYLEILCMVKL